MAARSKPDVIAPMEARAVDRLPMGPEWVYEPKYDGFRCLADTRSSPTRLHSKSGKDLARYFPELTAAAEGLGAGLVIDGEILPQAGDFEDLQLRLHPAESRTAKLARAAPAKLVAFDLLWLKGKSLLPEPFRDRRRRLEDLLARGPDGIELGEQVRDGETALSWIGKSGLDGVMAKRLDRPYQAGKRSMQKYKIWRRVDCVVGGFYEARGQAEALLLGLYDEEGLLHYVGACRLGFDTAEMTQLLGSIRAGSPFTGRRPGKKDRWSGAARNPVTVEPRVVAEVETDHVSRDFMRHGARLCRFRPDKAPETCSITQLSDPVGVAPAS